MNNHPAVIWQSLWLYVLWLTHSSHWMSSEINQEKAFHLLCNYIWRKQSRKGCFYLADNAQLSPFIYIWIDDDLGRGVWWSQNLVWTVIREIFLSLIRQTCLIINYLVLPSVTWTLSTASRQLQTGSRKLVKTTMVGRRPHLWIS